MTDKNKQRVQGVKLPAWYQLYVKEYTNGSSLTVEAAKRIDEHLNKQAASAFVAPDGMPVRNADGEFEIRCFSENHIGFVESILTEHYGLKIEGKVKHL